MGIKPESILNDMTAERCAEICYLEDSFVCRSFDYSLEKSSCFLYSQSIKDRDKINLEIVTDLSFNHYSRSKTNKTPRDESKNTLSATTIFLSTLCISIGGFLFGILTGFVYVKLTANKNQYLPSMKFINPSYKSDSVPN